MKERIASYKSISDKAERIGKKIPDNRKDTYFQLVKYPVQASAQMNNKHLKAQLAKYSKCDFADVVAAQDSIVALTAIYNNEKWNRMMDYKPRNLPVFLPLEEKTVDEDMVKERRVLLKINLKKDLDGRFTLNKLTGYDNYTVNVRKNDSVVFNVKGLKADSVMVEFRLLPTHPVNERTNRFRLKVDKSFSADSDYRTVGRSEEWKQNVLRNQAVRSFKVPVKKNSRFVIKPLDEGFVIDQIFIYPVAEK